MISRLFGICYQLILREKVSAKELAEYFEVSQKTIYRDVETLSMAGIPIYTIKGRGGGIALMEHFVIDRMFVSKEEKRQILSALESLEEMEPDGENQNLLHRLSDFFQMPGESWLSVDFSDWNRQMGELYSLLKAAVLDHQLLEFDYYGSDGRMSHRVVEPVQLWFKGSAWYLRAWCRERKAMRTFKLFRIKRCIRLPEYFVPHEGKEGEQKENGKENAEEKKLTRVRLRIDASQAYRIYDDFDEEEISMDTDGFYIIDKQFPVGEWVYEKILSYCPHVSVLEPNWFREHLLEILKRSQERLN
ncbi:MAG TPA: YafY family transcriptional regulator [Candidatus Eisenbergiella merdipullorum]|uniref:YafY family transcriptional regulator n=1 Tax=Candidatus Eisenbergiella merdipullorum TaxID=2838553 RepID=A0A9D2I7K2_9FIRM|nr:YafY family transcriptional regulator [Candidatus Eisenbergiella merdipullorum]